MITDATGNTAREENFLPFGLSAAENIPLPAVAEDAKGFIGERFDPDAGPQYLNARYYDPEPGVGTNRYSYSFNDPVNLSDPLGNCVITSNCGGDGGPPDDGSRDIDDYYDLDNVAARAGLNPGEGGLGVHGMLEVAGLVPVLGEPADILNATIYAAKGDMRCP